ncbi:PREDICTED: heat shock transcription factor, X-linked-like [Charadrius vociferus]|uniref:heat shock transcription factor, X-linked-like n=1 Tax=Charadrius vociferus TaxID=50402 RepID=UPI000521BE33|nr:PREDICTED: heat shock transcription factor, X-linked-like [Charadrius vociferus]
MVYISLETLVCDAASGTPVRRLAGELWQSFSSYFFLKKLWKIVGSNWFQSIWWGDAGNIVLAERFFKFETESMKMFIHQLNLHGFRKNEGFSSICLT